MKNKTSGWVFFANNDMISAKTLMEYAESTGAELTGEVAFLCQQAIEKYFKGYLAEQDKRIQKIHDLLALYSEVKSTHDWNLDSRVLAEINKIYTIARYPGNIGMTPEGRLPTMEEAKSYLECAKKVEAIFMELVGK
ncbi:MAG: HEPN domain-containing protein [Chitinispirillales bacterium]|jgi:HEPN domain-containing protein|nr:HEPN domain-containing protein [Chitinispirillales bacterium]